VTARKPSAKLPTPQCEAADAGRQPADDRQIGIAVDHVIQEVAAGGGSLLATGERAVDQIQPAIGEDQDAPGNVEQWVGDDEGRGRGDCDTERDDADAVRCQPNFVGPGDKRRQ